MDTSSDTIFALASGQGRSGISVIRISGPSARMVLDSVAGGVPGQPRRLALRTLVDPSTGEKLDQALAVWMPAPASFTGEDQAELHIHGGAAVRAAVLSALFKVEGCRPAAAGEFTRRAFLNGKMDLSAVEGLADLIDAETQAQRRQALRQLDGHLGRRVEDWRERIIGVMALLEASLDFSDEGDVGDTLEQQALPLLEALRTEIAGCLDDGQRGERLRDGFTVVLAGPPNAGKSTLLNALARREVAIVSPEPGTTRDAIEVRLELNGLPVTLVDTAGMREACDPVEREGVSRTRRRMRSADLVVWLTPVNEAFNTRCGLPDQNLPPASLRVATKSDLGCPVGEMLDVRVSALTGEGLPVLLDRLTSEARKRWERVKRLSPANATDGLCKKRLRRLTGRSRSSSRTRWSWRPKMSALRLAPLGPSPVGLI
jgi:tRNA modification GTPase